MVILRVFIGFKAKMLACLDGFRPCKPFLFLSVNINRSFYPPFVQFMGYRLIIGLLKNALTLVRYYAIINLSINKNLAE